MVYEGVWKLCFLSLPHLISNAKRTITTPSIVGKDDKWICSFKATHFLETMMQYSNGTQLLESFVGSWWGFCSLTGSLAEGQRVVICGWRSHRVLHCEICTSNRYASSRLWAICTSVSPSTWVGSKNLFPGVVEATR